MKILVSSLEDQAHESEVEVSELNYDRENNLFYMRCVMGDDWFQRVTSSLPFAPLVVRFVDRIAFVVFSLHSDANQFTAWLREAEAAVQNGYRTMRG